MKHYPKAMHKVTTERVVGFGAAVRSLGKHEQCGAMVDYTPQHVRMVLSGRQKSEKLLRLIAARCPEMFDLCKVCDEVKTWYDSYIFNETDEQRSESYEEDAADVERDMEGE